MYAGLLRGTRGLSREGLKLREQWFMELALDHKSDVLFELEMLLKGISCFASPRNHPRAAPPEPIYLRSFSAHLQCVREGLLRASSLADLLVHKSADSAAAPIHRCAPGGSLHTASPALGLRALKSDLIKHLTVVDGLLRARPIPFRLFFACTSSIAESIAHGAFFNTGAGLEFCPEYDRIPSSQMLGALRALDSDRTQHFAVLIALSLFRVLRYLSLLDALCSNTAGDHFAERTAFLILAALKSDVITLARYVCDYTGPELAAELERDLMAVPAADIFARFEELHAHSLRMSAFRDAFASLVLGLRMEIQHVFARELPTPSDEPEHADPRPALRQLVHLLQPGVQNALLFLARSLGGTLDEQTIFPAPELKRARSLRLRRDVWMFAQILRAFSSKARHADVIVDHWTSAAGFSFVRDFWSYFRAMGYPLLWTASYPRADAFMNAMRGLRAADLVDRDRLEAAISACENFYAFLTRLFDQISRRPELSGVPFDRREAARTLRHYVTG